MDQLTSTDLQHFVASPVFRTTVTIEVLSDCKLDNSTFGDIASMVFAGDVFAKESTYSSELLSPANLDEACEGYENIDRSALLGEECKTDQPHLKFEYDEDYSGESHNGVGKTVFIPMAVYQDKFDGNSCAAFEWWTGVDPAHIIRFAGDEVYTVDGEEWDGEA